MPLTKAGAKTEKNFKKEYGKKGEGFFYAFLNKKSKPEQRKYHPVKKGK